MVNRRGPSERNKGERENVESVYKWGMKARG